MNQNQIENAFLKGLTVIGTLLTYSGYETTQQVTQINGIATSGGNTPAGMICAAIGAVLASAAIAISHFSNATPAAPTPSAPTTPTTPVPPSTP